MANLEQRVKKIEDHLKNGYHFNPLKGGGSVPDANTRKTAVKKKAAKKN